MIVALQHRWKWVMVGVCAWEMECRHCAITHIESATAAIAIVIATHIVDIAISISITITIGRNGRRRSGRH
jgi:hypothetical protein